MFCSMSEIIIRHFLILMKSEKLCLCVQKSKFSPVKIPRSIGEHSIHALAEDEGEGRKERRKYEENEMRSVNTYILICSNFNYQFNSHYVHVYFHPFSVRCWFWQFFFLAPNARCFRCDFLWWCRFFFCVDSTSFPFPQPVSSISFLLKFLSFLLLFISALNSEKPSMESKNSEAMNMWTKPKKKIYTYTHQHSETVTPKKQRTKIVENKTDM